MNKDEFGDLLADIGGGREIGIAARRERDAAEQEVLSQHEAQIWALLCLGDALHQFYRDSLDLVRVNISRTAPTDVQIAMLHWHVVSFNRFAAAFDLMAHGYYFEAMVLARDLWEVALSLAGLKRNVVTLNELLASNTRTGREAEELSRKSDAKIRRVLIWENAALSDKARKAVETFGGIANLAMHKSKLHLGLNMSHVVSGHATPIFPRFDVKRASVAHNVFYLSSWSIVSTLPYLDFALGTTNLTWRRRYDKVQVAFREGLATGPNLVVQAWPEIIDQVF